MPTIESWEILWGVEALTVDNATSDSLLYEQNFHAMKLHTTDRLMTRAELEATPEWADILAQAKPYTVFYQQPTIGGNLTMAITAVTPDLVNRLVGILGTLGIDVKALRDADAVLQQKQGDLTTLTTTEKSNLVAAINEVKSTVGAIDLTALIDDENVATDTVFSSQETLARISAALDDLINGAPGTRDTLKEISDAIDGNSDVITTINTALQSAVRFDIAQNKTEVEKAQARANVGAASEADLTQLAANVGNIAELAATAYTNPRDGV